MQTEKKRLLFSRRMKTSILWPVFAIFSIGWLVASLCVAPSGEGVDALIFRDAGWNLACTGHFAAAGLPHMHDLVPRFYALTRR